MRATASACLLVAVLIAAAGAAADSKVEKLTFRSVGTTGTYYLFVPEKAAGGPAPLLLLLHGSGHNGKSLIDPWLPLAKSEGIILVAPDASDPRACSRKSRTTRTITTAPPHRSTRRCGPS
jgi:poly(3-hydroxybutyrate) depolymerase